MPFRDHAKSPNAPTIRSVVIIGAGPAGLAAALELAQRGILPTVLESDPVYVGGLSRTVVYKGFRFDIGGHRFFSKNSEIVSWWRQRLPNDFIRVPRKSRILYRGRFYDYPLRPFNALGNLGILTSARCVTSYLWRQLKPISPERSFEDWTSNRFGKTLFNIFFRTYTEKVWGIPCSEISADWASQRIKGLSLKEAILAPMRGRRKGASEIKTLIEEFEYPRLGPGMMWEKTAREIEAIGGRIVLGRRVTTIRREGAKVLAVETESVRGDRECWSADAFLCTMPLRDAVVCMRKDLGESAQAAARRLQYRDFVTVALILNVQSPFTDNWIYVHDPGVFVGRVQSYGNWSSGMLDGRDTACLGMEYFCAVSDALWNRSDADFIELAIREIEAIGLARRENVRDATVVRMEKAYPVYDVGYEDNVQEIRAALAGLQNFLVAGRNGMHKYNNQDHSMLTGMLAARAFAGESLDPWKVNTDAEYHESAPSHASGRAMPRRTSNS